jgi:hypothetical protein
VIAAEADAVFPRAYLVAENLYTGQRARVQAGIVGSFTLTLPAVAGNPILLTASETPYPDPAQPFAYPEASIGTIIYAPFPESQRTFAWLEPIPATPGAEPAAGIGTVSALALEPGEPWSVELFYSEGQGAAEAVLLVPVALADDEGETVPVRTPEAEGIPWTHTRNALGLPLLDVPYPAGNGAAARALPLASGDDDRLIARADDSLTQAWIPGLYSVGIQTTTGARIVVPLTIRVGGVGEVVALPILFADHPSSGARGLPPEAGAALVDGLSLPPPAYVLRGEVWAPGENTQPALYPLEPYLLGMSDQLAGLPRLDNLGSSLVVRVRSARSSSTM